MINGQKYIYLDWNVVKYLRVHRKGSEFRDAELMSLISKLKEIYRFPFSIYHVQDRLSKYNKEYEEDVEADLSFFEKMSEQWCVGWDDNSRDICLEKHSILDCREIAETKTKEAFHFQTRLWGFPNMSIDMTKMDKSNPFYDFLSSHQAKLSPLLMQEFLVELYNSIFTDGFLYKKFRNYIENHKQELLNPLLKNSDSFSSIISRQCYAYIKSFDFSVEELEKNWKEIAYNFFYPNFGSNVPLGVLLSHGYMLLEMHPLFHDKLSKNKNNLGNILRDSNHLFFASKADYLLSEDKHFREKAKFIYKVYGINTLVVSEEEFLKNLSLSS